MPLKNLRTDIDYADELELWVVYRTIMLKRGIDIDQRFLEWAHMEQKKLHSPGAHDDFQELCGRGCAPQILAALIAAFRWSPDFETNLVRGGG